MLDSQQLVGSDPVQPVPWLRLYGNFIIRFWEDYEEQIMQDPEQ